MPVRGGGFIEGYTTQNVTTADRRLIATELTAGTTGTTWFEPMLRQAQAAAAFTTAHRRASGSDSAAGGDGDASLITLFLARLVTPEGLTAYRQRSHITQTPHGNIKHNTRLRQHSAAANPKPPPNGYPPAPCTTCSKPSPPATSPPPPPTTSPPRPATHPHRNPPNQPAPSHPATPAQPPRTHPATPSQTSSRHPGSGANS
jgi:hypothetical protein